MPSKNSVKTFVEDGYYHVYNRGVDKQVIFLDERDYAYFLWIVGEYLQPDHPSPSNPLYVRRGLTNEVSVLCYCLMPNHFHFLIKQNTKNGLTKIMRRICTIYVTYFNKRYGRSGGLFQGKYKAVLIDHDAYLTHITSYIHRNPTGIGQDYTQYKYSSYQKYIGNNGHKWLNTKEILDLFTTKNNSSPKENYARYLKSHSSENDEVIEHLSIDTNETV